MYRFTTLMTIGTLALASQAAIAAPAPDAPSMLVRFADLDLTRMPGAAVLYRRIEHAASTVCASFDGRDPSHVALFQGCTREAIAASVAKVNQPALTAYYRMRTGASSPTIQLAGK
jgi:UrcA family protein